MKYQKILAILFSILSFGAIKETTRIFTSSDADIVENRSWLIPMTIFLLGLFVYLAIMFWKKSSTPK